MSNCKLNVCVALEHTTQKDCRFHGDHSTILGERIRQQREGTGIPSTRCDHEPSPGFVRVYISPGPKLVAHLHRGWSEESGPRSGHSWYVLDIPQDLFDRQKEIWDKFDAIQLELRAALKSTKTFCTCGSDHANLPSNLDF